MWVCIDSDIFFLRHMDESDFHSRSGRPLLLEPVDCPTGPTAIEFRDASAKMLGIDEAQLDPRVLYSSWSRDTSRVSWSELFQYIERRRRLHWWEAMARVSATEYETYGLFARHIHECRNVGAPEDQRWCWLFYDLTKFDGMLRWAINEKGVKAAMVDSHLDCDLATVQEVVKKHWIP